MMKIVREVSTQTKNNTMDIIRFLNSEDVNVSTMNCIPVEQRSFALKMLYDKDILNNLLRQDSELGMKVIGITQQALACESFRNEIDIVSCRAFHKWIFGESPNLPELTMMMKIFILGLHSSTEHAHYRYYKARYNAAATIQNAIDMGGETPHSQDEWFELKLSGQYGLIIFGSQGEIHISSD